MRRVVFAISDGFARHFMYMRHKRILSVFVDESGRFRYPDDESRFYILGMVLHDQSFKIDAPVANLNRSFADLDLDADNFVFHAGPLIRQEKGFASMSRRLRGRIFDRMMQFARKVDFKYHCLVVDKRFVNSQSQIVDSLRLQLDAFFAGNRKKFADIDEIKVYYDCGQTPVTNLLHQTFEAAPEMPVSFAQGVKPGDYKLFQLADLICTLKLIELRLQNNLAMTNAEHRFFGGPRAFKRNILKHLSCKCL